MPSWTDDLTVATRIERHDEIDTLITAWTTSRDVDAATELLQTAGVPAGKLARLPEVAGNGQLAARDYYEMFEHPIAAGCGAPATPRASGSGL